MPNLDVNILNSKTTVQLKTVVGRTYDALKSSYASPEYVLFTKPILDMSKITIVENKLIVNKTEYKTGNSLLEIAKEFSTSVTVGSEIKMFSGSVSTDFKEESESSSEMSYCKVFHLNIKKRQGFSNVTDYKKFLLPEFKADLKYLIPEDFFKKYGTHLIVDAWFGGRLEFNFSRKKSIYESEESLKVNVEAGFAKIFTSQVTTNFSEETKEVFENSSLSARIIGGSNFQTSSLDDFGKEYSKWAASLDLEKNWEFCALPIENGLVPLWELCDDYLRRDELENFYRQLAYEAENNLLEGELFVKDIKFVHNKNDNQAKCNCPSGYEIIKKDLNSGAGGDYVYLCYLLAKNWDYKTKLDIDNPVRFAPVTNCFIIETEREINQEGVNNVTYKGIESRYYFSNVNLNEGSGLSKIDRITLKKNSKNYIYFAHTHDKNFLPIKNLAVVFDNEEISTKDWEVVRWKKNLEAADLNIDVEGKHIYIYMKKAKYTPKFHSIIEMTDEEKTEAKKLAEARRIIDEKIKVELEETEKQAEKQEEKQTEKKTENEMPEELAEDGKYKISLEEIGSVKAETIKLIKEITKKTLKEAKDIVEGVPSIIKEEASKSEALNIRDKLKALGAYVEIIQEDKKFDLILKSIGSSKIEVIKLVMEITNKGLKQAKDLVDTTPVTLKNGISETEFLKLKVELELIGCTVDTK